MAETEQFRTEGAPTLDADAALAEFEAADALLRGHFLLSSGRHSSLYLQCALVMADPTRGGRLCAALGAKIRSARLDAPFETISHCVSPAMGAVIVGYETARALGVRSLFMERPDGAFTLRRGFSLPAGAPCLMVEDVVTTGKSSRECLEAIRAAGGRPVGAACLVDRTAGKVDLGVPLVSLLSLDAPTYAPDDVPPELAAIPAVKPGSRPGLTPAAGAGEDRRA